MASHFSKIHKHTLNMHCHSLKTSNIFSNRNRQVQTNANADLKLKSYDDKGCLSGEMNISELRKKQKLIHGTALHGRRESLLPFPPLCVGLDQAGFCGESGRRMEMVMVVFSWR